MHSYSLFLTELVQSRKIDLMIDDEFGCGIRRQCASEYELMSQC